MLTRPSGRALLAWLLLATAVVLATYVCVSAYRSLEAARRDAGRVDARAEQLLATLAELRVSSQAFAVTARPVDWTAEVEQRVAELRAQIEQWQAETAEGTAAEALGEAQSAVDALEHASAQIRDFVRNGQRALATEVAFADTAGMTRTLTERLSEARAAERERRAAFTTSKQRQAELAVLALVAMSAVMLWMIASGLVRISKEAAVLPVQTATFAPETPATSTPLEGLSLSLRDPPVTETVVTPSMPKALDWFEAASVCTDFARVRESSELEGLLDRAARVVDAKGLIVWLADDNRRLRAVLAHGYDQRLIKRLPTLEENADNVTALAFRSSETRVLPARGGYNSAVAAPLLAPMGCFGVVSLELNEGYEERREVIAAVRILSAQLAGVLMIPATTEPVSREAHIV